MNTRTTQPILTVLAGLALLPLALLPGTATAELPLEGERDGERRLAFEVESGTWMSLDVSPDHQGLVLDLLGDLYTLPIKGGQAGTIRSDIAFESQPVYSPNGEHLAFISDGNGNENLWISRADGSQARPLSQLDDNTEFVSPGWSADGQSVFVSRLRPDRGAMEIWRYPIDKAPADDDAAEPITRADPATARDERRSTVGAASSPDGRFLYYAATTGFTRLEGAFQPWHIVRRDLDSGGETTLIERPGGAVRPVLSPDGRYLAYASRRDGHSSLRLHDLKNGEDRELAYPVQDDQQQRWATLDLMPRHSFTADGNALLYSQDGSIHRIELDSGETKIIPFRAEVEQAIGPSLQQDIPVENGPVRARLIQTPAPAPDGDRVAFSALSDLYVMTLDSARDHRHAKRLTPDAHTGYHPAWSPDAKQLVYVSWNAHEGGHVWRLPAEGGDAQRLSKEAAWYSRPAISPDGESILLLRGNHQDRLRTPMEYGVFREAELIRLPMEGGPAQTLAHGRFAGPPQFLNRDERIYLYGEDGLQSFAADGSDPRQHFQVTGPSYYFEETRSPVQDLRISPDGRHALAVMRSQLHLLAVPEQDGATIDLGETHTPNKQITTVGADFTAWADGGDTVIWAVGHDLYRRPLETLELNGPPEDNDRIARHSDHTSAIVERPRDEPQGTLLLRGATLITMRGEEVIEDGELLIENNRIAAVGGPGDIKAPENADIRELDGRYIVPGFIDTHAHWADIRRDLLDHQAWGFFANLAFGITAGLDVSTLTIDMLAYQDMIDAGLMPGPRAFSTGPAVFSFNEFQSRQAVTDVLRRYRDHYRLHNLKQYRVGNRRQRQWFAMAADELDLMPTTEGADNLKLSLTQILDGFAGLEHALPVSGIADDVIQLMAQSELSYSPTLLISDSKPGLDRFIANANLQDDARIQRFVPPSVIEEKTESLNPRPEDRDIVRRHAQDTARLHRAGVTVGAGSHGEVQGIALHWEMQALASGGLTPHEVLHIATLGSSKVIGRDNELGSLDTGKLADLVILERNPLDDIRHSQSAEYVMKNGRLYRAHTLDEVWPRRRSLPSLWFHDSSQ